MKRFLTLFTLALLSTSALAEQSITFGNYTAHYNAFRSDDISADVARRHGIIRSSHRAVLNVTVLRNHADGSTTPVAARIQGSATNLNGQLNTLHFFPVREQETIYYLDQFRIDDHETLRFHIEVQPEPSVSSGTEPTPGVIQFTQNFYTG